MSTLADNVIVNLLEDAAELKQCDGCHSQRDLAEQ